MWLLHSIDFSLTQNNSCALSVDKCFLYEPCCFVTSWIFIELVRQVLTLWLRMWCIRFWIIWLLIPHVRFKESGVRTCEIKHDPGLSHILVVYKRLSIEWVKLHYVGEYGTKWIWITWLLFPHIDPAWLHVLIVFETWLFLYESIEPFLCVVDSRVWPSYASQIEIPLRVISLWFVPFAVASFHSMLVLS